MGKSGGVGRPVAEEGGSPPLHQENGTVLRRSASCWWSTS